MAGNRLVRKINRQLQVGIPSAVHFTSNCLPGQQISRFGPQK